MATAQVRNITLTEPTAYPIARADAKAHARIETTDEDLQVDAWIAAATDAAQKWTLRQLVVATRELMLDDFPQGVDAIYVPRPPLVTVDSIVYTGADGVATTLAASAYYVDKRSEPGRIVPTYGTLWPTTQGQISGVVVTYKAGYVAPYTVDAGTDTLTVQGRTFADDDIVRVSVSGGSTAAVPGGLSLLTDYYVVNASGATCQLSLTEGGAAIDITSTGTGTQYIGRDIPTPILQGIRAMVAKLYEARSDVAVGVSLSDVPSVCERLWDMWAVPGLL